MRTDKPDRRVNRTRQLLRDALLALILEKQYEAITVQDIIDRANVSRSTFYTHYHDKDDLFLTGAQNVFESLTVLVAQEGSVLLPSLELFRHAREHYPLYKALVRGQGADLMFRRGQKYLSEHIEKQLLLRVDSHQPPAMPVSVLANFLAGTFFTLVRWWLDNRMAYSTEQMDEMFQQLTMPSVLTALGRESKPNL